MHFTKHEGASLIICWIPYHIGEHFAGGRKWQSIDSRSCRDLCRLALIIAITAAEPNGPGTVAPSDGLLRLAIHPGDFEVRLNAFCLICGRDFFQDFVFGDPF
jgi:hypothetical protein